MPDAALTDNVSYYTATFHDTYVRQQVVTTCTSGTRPTGVEGRCIFETDTNLLLTYDGSSWVQMGATGAWVSWTPTVTQSGSVTVTNTRSRYTRHGRTIHFSINVSVTGSGTASNEIVVSLPVEAASANDITAAGTGLVYDDSVGIVYPGIMYPSSTTAFRLKASDVSTGVSLIGSGAFAAGLASSDWIRVSGTYEAA